MPHRIAMFHAHVEVTYMHRVRDADRRRRRTTVSGVGSDLGLSTVWHHNRLPQGLRWRDIVHKHTSERGFHVSTLEFNFACPLTLDRSIDTRPIWRA